MGEVLDVAMYPIKGAQPATINGEVPCALEATRAGFRFGDFGDREFVLAAGDEEGPLTVVTPRGWNDDRGPRTAHKSDRFLASLAVDIADEGKSLNMTRRDGEHYSVSLDEQPDEPGLREVHLHGGRFMGIDWGEDAAKFFSGVVGRPVRFLRSLPSGLRTLGNGARSDARAADAHPYLITNQISLDYLNDLAGTDVPMARYRPNIVVATEAPNLDAEYAYLDEDTANIIRVGNKWFRVASASGRCIVTTMDERGELGGDGLRVLEPRKGTKLRSSVPHPDDDAGKFFGDNAVLSGLFTDSRLVTVGDRVEIVARTAPHVRLAKPVKARRS